MRLRSRRLRTFLLLASVLAVFYGTYRLSRSRRWQPFGELVERLDTHEKVVALTFDDGPSPLYTDQVLDLLEQHQVPATFFVVGSQMQKFPELGKEIVRRGHAIANHSWSHKRMIFESQEFYASEIEHTDVLLRDAGQRGELFFRPPYGKKLFGLPWYLAKTGRTTIMWDVEAEADPSRGKDSASITRFVLENVRPGSIVLFHVMSSVREPERSALPNVIQGLRAQGYQFLSVAELVARMRRGRGTAPAGTVVTRQPVRAEW